MAKKYGVHHVMTKKHRLIELESEWSMLFGQLPDPFTMIVIGEPKNGKTDLLMKFCKSLAKRYKVFYSSNEEGNSLSMQEAFHRNDMESAGGKLFLGEDYTFDELVDELSQPRSAKVIILDSLDYMGLTYRQYQELIRLFPRKSFIVVTWGVHHPKDFAKPRKSAAKDIKHKVGVIVLVKDFVAKSRSRYGETEDYVIWKEGAAKALQPKPRTLFDQ